MFFRSGFNSDNDVASVESSLECQDDSLAIQSSKDECDINTIVRKFGLTGELPNDIKMPQTGDFTNIPDFHTAMNIIRTTQEEFLRVPPEVRARFNNDPQRFMEFVEDDSNRDEARRLGLLRLDPIVPASGTPDAGAAAG